MKPHFSPSQFNEAARCLRRWHYSTVLGRRQPETDAMRRGTRIHRMLEVFVTDPDHPLPVDQKTVTYTEQLPMPLLEPDGRVVDKQEVTIPCDAKEQRLANGALLLVPNPVEEELVAEGEFLLPSEVTGLGKPVKGFIDLWIPGSKTLVDYKTRSSDRYDKEEEELRHDPQCVLYAAEKMLHIQPDPDGKRRLNFQHINIYTDGKRARRVQLDNITEDEVEQGLQRLRPLAQRMLIAETLPVTEVPVNLQACGDYRGCPFRVECGANGLPVFGDNWQSRSAKQMAMAQGTYRSPEELEEKMAGFASALKNNPIVAVNPPDGTPASVVGSVETHKAVEAATVEARSELDEEGHGEAPSEATVNAGATVGRVSARDKSIQVIMELAKTIDTAERLAGFHAALGSAPESPEALKALLLKMSGPNLKHLQAATTALFAKGDSAPAPAAVAATSSADGLALPKTLAEFDNFVQTIDKLIASGEASVTAINGEIASWSSKRNQAETDDDLDAAEACTARISQLRRTLKENKDTIAELRTKYSPEELDKIKTVLTPPPVVQQAPAPAPAVEPPAVTEPMVVTGVSKPILLIRSQLIAQDTAVLHVETIISKYQAAVAAAAGVESVHDIKYEGSARVAALLAKDINSGLLDVRKYAAISVPRRGAAWDPVIDVLRPFVRLIIEGVG